MTFLPRSEVLSIEEVDRVCSAFVRLGVRKLCITGGEPLVRRHIMSLFQSLRRHLETAALDELTLTTNGSQLARYAHELKAAGVRRINVSHDTLNPDKFAAITATIEQRNMRSVAPVARPPGINPLGEIKLTTLFGRSH